MRMWLGSLSVGALLASVVPAQIVFELYHEEVVPNLAWDHHVAVGDLDGDGDPDIVNSASTSLWWENLGGGNFASPQPLKLGPATDMRLADVVGDDALDLVRAEATGVFVYAGHGDGSFGAGLLVHGQDANAIWRIEVTDLTGDGALDVISLSGEPVAGQMQVDLIASDGAGGFLAPVLLQGPLGGAFPADVTVGDLDGDALPDMVLQANTLVGSSVRIYLGTGGGAVAFSHHISLGDFKASDVALADLEGDGDLDLMIGGNFGFATFTGQGDGSFGPAKSWSTRVFNDGAVLADIDGDGNDDVTFHSGATWELVVLTGDGQGAFAEAFTATNFGSSDDLQAADLDQDGAPDLVLASISGAGQSSLTRVRNHTYPAGSPWLDLGQGKTGFTSQGLPAKPILTADGTLAAGEPVSLALARNNSPATIGYVIMGLSALSAPFQGGTLVPAPDVVVGPIPSLPGKSALVLTGTWPAGMPSGTSIWIQAWLHGVGTPLPTSATSAVRGITP
jgi:FG-GAP-like repeat